MKRQLSEILGYIKQKTDKSAHFSVNCEQLLEIIIINNFEWGTHYFGMRCYNVIQQYVEKYVNTIKKNDEKEKNHFRMTGQKKRQNHN